MRSLGREVVQFLRRYPQPARPAGGAAAGRDHRASGCSRSAGRSATRLRSIVSPAALATSCSMAPTDAPGSGSTIAVATCRSSRSLPSFSRPWSRPRIAASGGIPASIRWGLPAPCSSTFVASTWSRAARRSHSSSRERCSSRMSAPSARKGQEAVITTMLETRLTKEQILELYLNRVYLSGGLYGVEAMSMGLFGKHANAVSLGRSGAHRRPRPGAIGPLAVVESRRRTPSQRHGAAANAVGRIHHPGAGQRGSPTTAPHPPVPGARGSAARLREGVSAPAVPEPLRRRSSGRLGGPHDARAGAAGRRRAGGHVGAASARHPQPAGGARRDRRRHRPRAGGGRRQRLHDDDVQSGGAQPAAAGFRLQAGLVRGGARARVQPGQRAARARRVAASGPRGMDAAQCVGRDRGSADAARGVHRIEQSRRRGASAADRHPTGPATGVGSRHRVAAGRPVARARVRAW